MDRTLLYEASMAWAPDFPRQATFGNGARQGEVTSRLQLRDSLMRAAENGGPGYTSVYSFPNGHSTDGNLPKIDTLFFDLDIPSDEGSYNPREGGEVAAWRRDMSKLLVRARMVASWVSVSQWPAFLACPIGSKAIRCLSDPPGANSGCIRKFCRAG